MRKHLLDVGSGGGSEVEVLSGVPSMPITVYPDLRATAIVDGFTSPCPQQRDPVKPYARVAR
jgi:hypothetical protein